jgi:FAD dependent oxidoreductase TIGR03364
MKRALIVGGGVIGTMHAVLAAEKGFAVTHLERDMKPQSASVRNFGLIWVSGRRAGGELDLALRARTLWATIGSRAEIGFRANGSLTIAQSENEYTVIQEAASMLDAEKRGFRLLNRNQTLALEPELAGKYVGSLQCTTDAAVEPAMLLGGLREYLKSFPEYTWVPEFEVVDFYHDENGNHVSDIFGRKYSGEYIALCAGAAHKGFIESFLEKAPLRKVRLQMASTAPLGATLSHSLADADSLRYYPAFKELSLALLGAQSEIATQFKMQLLLVQRLDGSMTIGDTHEYIEPFTHEIDEAPYDHLRGVMNNIFGREVPRIEKRWDGVYSQSTSEEIYIRREIAPGAHIVTGGGGRGNTLAPAIAEETVELWSL